MRLGALLSPILASTNPQALAEQARRLAGEGFESLWVAQAMGRGFMLSDPLMSLAVAATVTEETELGTAVLQLSLYAPGELAHRILTLQQLCGDRLRLGVGAGSTEQDFQVAGRDYNARFARFNIVLEELREVFAEGGTDRYQISPWPSVQGGPPLFLGSWGHGVARAAKEFDGWIASAMHRNADEVITALEGYRAAGGRRAMVSTIQVSEQTDLGELGARLERFAAAGFDDAAVILLPGAPNPAAIRGLIG